MSDVSRGPAEPSDIFANESELEADLILLEHLKAGRKAFVEQLCSASRTQTEAVLAVLRMESTYLIAEFFDLIRAHGIDSADQLQRLAELHNHYISELIKDTERATRFGLSTDRLLDAIFTGDTMPRLIQQWVDRPGALDQSNLARFLVTLMSAESCRKIVVACEQAGFLERERTRTGATVVRSTGIMEGIFARGVRSLRLCDRGRSTSRRDGVTPSAPVRSYGRQQTKGPVTEYGAGPHIWLRGLDLNQRPSGYEPDELPGCSTPR